MSSPRSGPAKQNLQLAVASQNLHVVSSSLAAASAASSTPVKDAVLLQQDLARPDGWSHSGKSSHSLERAARFLSAASVAPAPRNTTPRIIAPAARVMGIDTDRVYAFTFALNAAICGAAGAMISMIWVIQPFYGIAHSIRSFVIVTAAGFGNLPGVIMAGLGLGVMEGYGGFVLGAEFQQATVVGLLLLVLIYRQYQQRKLRQVVS